MQKNSGQSWKELWNYIFLSVHLLSKLEPKVIKGIVQLFSKVLKKRLKSRQSSLSFHLTLLLINLAYWVRERKDLKICGIFNSVATSKTENLWGILYLVLVLEKCRTKQSYQSVFSCSETMTNCYWKIWCRFGWLQLQHCVCMLVFQLRNSEM